MTSSGNLWLSIKLYIVFIYGVVIHYSLCIKLDDLHKIINRDYFLCIVTTHFRKK